MNKAHRFNGPPVMHGLFKCIKDEAGMSRAAHTPTDNAAGIGVDNEGDINKALPGCDWAGARFSETSLSATF
jgi:hypothetical protein